MKEYNDAWKDFFDMNSDDKVRFLFFYCGMLGLMIDIILTLTSGVDILRILLFPVFLYYVIHAIH